MKKLLATAALIAVLVLSACSAISSGYITKKNHTEGYYRYEQYCAVYTYDEDGYGRCSLYGTRPVWVDPTWSFEIQDQNDDYETVTGWVSVDEETYNSYEVGDYYQNPNDVP